jgi:trehalose-6-phosphatase
LRSEIQHDAASGFFDLVEATCRLGAKLGSIPGVVVEPRKASVAVHYRPDRLKVMLGKMVYELQPKIDRANADDLEIADRAADFVLSSPTEVEQLLSTLAR